MDFLSLPLIFKTPIIHSGGRDSVDIEMPGDVCRSLIRMSDNSPFLLYSALMAVLNICLHRHTGRNTVVVGCPAPIASGQAGAHAIACQVDGQMSFRELLSNTKKTLVEAFQDGPVEFGPKEPQVERAETSHQLPAVVLALGG